MKQIEHDLRVQKKAVKLLNSRCSSLEGIVKKKTERSIEMSKDYKTAKGCFKNSSDTTENKKKIMTDETTYTSNATSNTSIPEQSQSKTTKELGEVSQPASNQSSALKSSTSQNWEKDEKDPQSRLISIQWNVIYIFLRSITSHSTGGVSASHGSSNCLCVSYCYSLIRKVLRANKERQRLSRNQKREIGLATMLLGVVVVFFICNLLPLVINIIETFQVQIPFELDYLLQTSNLLVTINSSVNFIIYVIFGEKFKRLFLILFCNNNLFRSGRESPDGVTHEDSFISNGDRHSLRLQRHSTSLSRNGTGSNFGRTNGSTRIPNRNSCRYNRTSSPGPCVYYPANRNNKEITQTTVLIGD
ncbi:unnamed protein product [Diabrotica balteata]|uniref:G-protein coupled receptors family 1 profile domain-containing protein n=1 Tax=Diabrotica balteata TaxID=107213 RepID=A0A9N9T6V5_DIABA|nr:unnamed protein product [Diabrotica balteata]